MQDDGPEKTADIMQMDEIYSNSALNISAAEGRVYEGLLFDRKILCMYPCRARVRASSTQEDVHFHAFPDEWFLRPSDASLNKRGWGFQERALAPRMCTSPRTRCFGNVPLLRHLRFYRKGFRVGHQYTFATISGSSRRYLYNR